MTAEQTTTTDRLQTAPLAHPRPPRRRAERPVTLYDLTLAELETRLGELGVPRYRARQLYHWAYQQLAPDYAAMTVLPKALRAELAERLPFSQLTPVRQLVSDDGETVKLLLRTYDGEHIETVLMFYPDRTTVCVSCQVGCAVGCAFCATGMMGLTRNLTAGEMVAQVIEAARAARQRGRALTNIVMMGMGEPFQNYANVMKLVAILHDEAGLNFGARRTTVSTSGLVPFIDRLAEEPYQVKLAISLHAPNDALRSQLVPLNRRYGVAELIAACRRYVARTKRRVTFEYALIKDVNDSDAIARELAALLKGLLCHVNVIPLNPTPAAPFERPSVERIERFAALLRAAGIPATVRYSRGVDIAAACGQLRVEHEQQAEAGQIAFGK
ncbi:MAG TPA: 23S rRNA (adenine(2503)-C(2))-methyltransferase RlmN [Thermomicrobiaceae bacterium]|nr:23S rRNA (adenine(2503)-C(2))-methyltransferase RlmN [Thermomicrobiaceae bacterium]